MKKIKLVIFTSAFFVLNNAIAQFNNGVEVQRPKAEREFLAKTLLSKYKNDDGLKTSSKNEILSEIYSLGLSKTAENFNFVASRLTANLPSEEKITLIKIIGDFYLPDDDIKKNSLIKKNLKNLMISSEKDISRAAILTYTRMGYFDDTIDLLKKSFSSGTLNKAGYSGELAHIIWFGSYEDQKIIIAELTGNSSDYGAEIIANYLSDDKYRNKIPADFKKDLLKFLSENEKKISNTIGEYSLFEALSYSEWLHAVAILTSDTQPKSYERVIIENIGQATSNPKKVIAYLSSDPGKLFFSGLSDADAITLMEKVNNFAENLPYPQSQVVLDLVKEIKNQRTQG